MAVPRGLREEQIGADAEQMLDPTQHLLDVERNEMKEMQAPCVTTNERERE